jgi:hypothetical protein
MKSRLLMVMLPALLSSLLFFAAAQAATDAPQFAAGDTWNYRVVNGFNHSMVFGSYTQTVAATNAGVIQIELRTSDGRLIDTASLAGPGRLASGMLNERTFGRLEPALQLMPFPLVEGQRWQQKVLRYDPIAKQTRTVSLYGKVEGWETIKVPAGEFRALKIVREMYLGDHDAFRGQTRLTEHEWYVPELKHWVKLQNWEEYHYAGDNVATGSYYQGDRLIFEMLSYQLAAR